MEITLIYHDVPAKDEWAALLAAYPTPAHVTADAPLNADEREALAVYFALQAPPEKPQVTEAEKEAFRRVITQTVYPPQGFMVRSTQVPTGITSTDTPVYMTRAQAFARHAVPELKVQGGSDIDWHFW